MKKTYIIFGIIGGLVELVAFFMRPTEMTITEFCYEMFFNIGFIILTIVIVNLLWYMVGGDPMEAKISKSIETLQLASDGFKGGLCRAFLSSSSFITAEQWIALLKKADHNVDMMGYSLHMLTRTKEFQRTLSKLANNNVKIRVLIMSDENEHFTAGLNFDGINSMTMESMKDEVVACTKCIENARESTNKNKVDNIKFTKIKKGLTECQIIRIDDKIYITPYLYSQHTADSPLFIFREQKDGYYKKYLEEFDGLWSKNVEQ